MHWIQYEVDLDPVQQDHWSCVPRASTTHSSHSLNVRSLNAACFAAGRQSVLQDDYLTLSLLDSSNKAFKPASRSLFHSFSRGRSPSRVTAPRPKLAHGCNGLGGAENCSSCASIVSKGSRARTWAVGGLATLIQSCLRHSSRGRARQGRPSHARNLCCRELVLQGTCAAGNLCERIASVARWSLGE